jgi:hypothetical protein
VEALEERRLLDADCTISGYVFYDANHDGLYNGSDSPLRNSPIELHDSTGAVVGRTTTDANGYYAFGGGSMASGPAQTARYTVTFTHQNTGWTRSGSVPRFDPSLGQLTEVDITNHGVLVGQIKVENLDATPRTLTGHVAGSLTFSGPGLPTLTASSSATETFSAAAFDGTRDFAGRSGHDFGPLSREVSRSATLTDASSLKAFIGTGTLSFTDTAAGASYVSSTGRSFLKDIMDCARADVTVAYHYLPENCLPNGKYTIIQTADPPGYIDGMVTQGNVVPMPNSMGSNTIPVTLAGSASTNNDFAEMLPSSLSGFVYYDVNNNGNMDWGDPPIPGTQITLTGADFLGRPVRATTQTGGDGLYQFTGLLAGNYTITETQPAGYLQGQNTVGSLGGTKGQDQFFVAVGQNVAGVDYNFGELLPTPPPPPAPPSLPPPMDLSKNMFISDGSDPVVLPARHRPRHRAARAPHHRVVVPSLSVSTSPSFSLISG